MSQNNYKNLMTILEKYSDIPEEYAIAYDWKGNELFDGDEAFIVDGEYVRDDPTEIRDYFIDTFEKISIEIQEDIQW